MNMIDVDRIHQNINARIDTVERRRTRTHRLAVAGIALAVVGGTTAGAVTVAQAPQWQLNAMSSCYFAADLGSQHGDSVYLPEGSVDAADLTVQQRVNQALDTCEQTWQIGTYDKDLHGADRPRHFAACTLPNGTIGVFPATGKTESEVCDALGLAEPK